ncbi:EAL domain-containing protein [Amphibacillus cookii]|uniref:EAL domain-containing protein n=1 Tax=Amphibacillus cookii TaxID=767787 RepID=UPI00195C6C43|nr:EAL domain-containing protein [Amphibacillus cookii]MBM7542099.1 diguanylate cyclase (GGDEF)-like protein/PAS domain S-box-containing protein [Amphibacillus cookii]
MTINITNHVLDYQKTEKILDQIYHTPAIELKDKFNTEVYPYLKYYLGLNETLKTMISKTFQMLVMDVDGYIIFINDDFCQQLGYQQEELLHHHYRILHAGVHYNDFYEEMWHTIRSGEVWQGDICTATKQGEMFWFRTRVIPIADQNGRYTTFIVLRTDISDVKHEDKRLIEALDDDYRKVFSQLMNLTFRVHRHKANGSYRFRMFEGKLADKLMDKLNGQGREAVENIFFTDKVAEVSRYFDQAFEGEEMHFKHHFHGLSLYTMLSPIYEDNDVIEVVGSSINITSLEKAEARVRQLAYFDTLTQLPNRTKFREDLKEAVINGEQEPFAVLYCDIDRLKYINDTLGEPIGDQVIDIIANRLIQFVEQRGVLYRYGGDEFSLIIHDSHPLVRELSEQMLLAIKQPIAIQGNEFFVTSSIGISYYGKDAFSDDELINHASIAVHYCKVNGRNSSLFYTPKMNKMYNDILLLEADIRKALQRNEFELYYQPQLNVLTGEVTGLEALIRWEHPLKGAISPATFIPLAEESGIITQIGAWVIREACHQHVRWVEAGHDPIRIAVNVSAIELQRFDFAEQIKQIIVETRMDPTYLEIEITENSVMQNTEDCIKTMHTLKEMGISLSIDDFGTGYSSFSYLKKFPIHFLKIDQSFIRSALVEPSSLEIVKAMIQLAHTFGLKVVAEGVEEEQVLKLLQDYDCDYYQGYYYSRPLPATDLEAILYRA